MNLIILCSNPDDRALQLELRVMGSSQTIPSLVNLAKATLIGDQDWGGNYKGGRYTADSVEGTIDATEELVDVITDRKSWKKHENHYIIDETIEIDASGLTYTA